LTDGTSRPFQLAEVESWPECREIIVEGQVGPGTIDAFETSLRRVVESDHDYVLIDLDRCESIDVGTVKQLVVARQHLSDQRREMLVFGAAGEVRRLLEDVGLFDCDPAPPPRPPGPHPRPDRLLATLSVLRRRFVGTVTRH
jgi:anti-anti-sigma regulatory factor